jgi:hypothetical protein
MFNLINVVESATQLKVDCVKSAEPIEKSNKVDERSELRSINRRPENDEQASKRGAHPPRAPNHSTPPKDLSIT